MSESEENQLKKIPSKPKFYGRRVGRPMSVMRRAVFEKLLETYGITLPEKSYSDLNELFPDSKSFELEIGFGGGEHLAAQALNNPTTGFIGVEAFLNGVSSLMKLIDKNSISNIRVFPNDVRQLFPFFPSHSFRRIYVLFPDPWPKTKHHKRRLINTEFLLELYRIMEVGGELRIASDHADYTIWIQEHLQRMPEFRFLNPQTIDKRPDDWCRTRYEEKALEQGISCNYMRFAK